MCIYLCWWGMISALICLQSSSRIALQASEAVRSLYQPRRPQDEIREHLMEVHTCTHTQTRAVAGGVKINLHAAAKFVDLNYTMTDHPKSKPGCTFYPNQVSVISCNHRIKNWTTRSILFSFNETWKQIHGGDLPRRIWHHGVWSSSNIHLKPMSKF